MRNQNVQKEIPFAAVFTSPHNLSRIREIENIFPQEVNGFPTNDISRIADDCEYDEALEHAEPLLNRRWIDVDVEHWYHNFDSSVLLTVDAMACYLHHEIYLHGRSKNNIWAE